jgi:hypothetical protein
VQRPPGGPLPKERRLALIRDPDGGDVRPLHAGDPKRLGHRADDAEPNLLGFVLDPARFREVLAELERSSPERPTIAGHHERRGPGRPLIDCKKVAAHGYEILPLVPLTQHR